MLRVQDLVARSALERLNGLSFKVENGQVLAIVGRSGCGSHLLGQVLASDQLTGGSVISGEVQINSYRQRLHLRRTQIQTGYLANPVKLTEFLTGFELLDLIGSLYHLSPKIRTERIGELAALLNIKQTLYSIIESISLANRQKIALAAAVIHQPKLLVLDEPTQFLDFSGEKQVKQLIDERTEEGTAIILITDRLELAEKWADQILILEKGQRLLEGTLAQLLNQTKSRPRTLIGVIEELFGHD